LADDSRKVLRHLNDISSKVGGGQKRGLGSELEIFKKIESGEIGGNGDWALGRDLTVYGQ